MRCEDTPDAPHVLQLPETTADFGYGPYSGQMASAIAASTRISIGQMSIERIDRRTKIMKNQIEEKMNASKYTGPRLFDDIGHNGHETMGSNDNDDDDDLENGAIYGDVVSTLQISNHPEWSGHESKNGDH